MIRLIISGESAGGSVLDLGDDEISIGRLPTNRIFIEHPHISGHHGLIKRIDGGYVYQDLKSTNGSTIRSGGELIALTKKNDFKVVLADRDRIVLGTMANLAVIEVRIVHESSSPMKAKSSERADEERTILATKPLRALDTMINNIERNQRALKALFHFTHTLSSTLDQREFVSLLTETVFHLYPQAGALILLTRDPETGKLSPVIAHARDAQCPEPEISRTIADKAIEEEQSILFSNAPKDFEDAGSVFDGGIRSGISAPLWNKAVIRGLLQVDNREEPDRFDETDLEVLTILGHQIAVFLEHIESFHRLSEDKNRLQDENTYLRREMERTLPFKEIIGKSKAMEALRETMTKVVDADTTVLIQGETGTGKELVARALHRMGPRSQGRFVAQNCAALPGELLESELFGHVEGAFSGAIKDKKGLLEIADKGTIFLDEITEMSLSMQAKLLRVLQEGEIRPVGATDTMHLDIRVLAATNRDLFWDVKEGRFREDLYYRINVYAIHVPPLRERAGDIALLAKHFLDKYVTKFKKKISGITDDALRTLETYPFPGNVRELENEIERAVLLAPGQGLLTVDLLSERVHGQDRKTRQTPLKVKTFDHAVDQLRRRLIEEALAETGNNKTRAAKRLGLSRQNLHQWITKLDIE